jgi:hypothetical protein
MFPVRVPALLTVPRTAVRWNCAGNVEAQAASRKDHVTTYAIKESPCFFFGRYRRRDLN